MTEPNSVEVRSENGEMQSLNMKASSSTRESDSPTFGSLSDTQDHFYARRTSDSQGSRSVRGSRSSTPTSGTDYHSCSNPSTPENTRSSERLASITSGSEVVSNVNMSANIANKLCQMRGSVENLDNTSQNSFEEVEVSEALSGLPHQESVPVGGESPVISRKSSSKQPSLRQVFPYVSCLPFENNIVFCFVLSVWDNIVGPQTVYVWKRKSFPSQKTCDGLLHEMEGGVEVAEERVELDDMTRSRLRTLSQQLEDQEEEEEDLSNSTRLFSADDQPSNGKFPYRNKSAPSRSDNDSPSHAKKQPSVPLGSKAESSKEDQHIVCGIRQSFNNENKLKNSCNDDVTQSAMRSCEDSDVIEEECKRPRPPSDAGCQTAAADNASNIGDSDGQELSSSWTSGGRSRLRMASVVRYVTEHTVAVGQVGLASEKITSSLLVVPHQGIIIVTARFTVLEEESGVPYCLSMVVPLEEYDDFLPLTQPVTSWLITIAASTRLLITKHGLEGGSYVKSKLVELCDVLVALRSASLDQYPLTPAGRPPDDRRLAEIILTSHLQTLGSTVVVADSPNAANKVVMWIAQFSDPADLHVSRLCLSYAQWPFHPGLSIQGIVRSANGEVNLSAQKLIQSSRPLTVVDINRGTVKQTGAPDVHARRNSSALHQELLSLWHDLPDVSAPSESLLEPVRGTASLVKRFLHDYDRLGSCENSVRQNFIGAFLRSLQYTALAIITWTRQEWAIQRRRSGYGSLRRALCSVFDLDDSDLRIVLAQAELLQPGFYTYVMM